MGWFGGKTSHEKAVIAVMTVQHNLFEKSTVRQSGDFPHVLKFELSDSRFRYYLFCFSTVVAACARHMKNPDAVLNDILQRAIINAAGEARQQFLGDESVTPQAIADRAGLYVQEYLHRWSAYVDIVGGNPSAATGIVVGMLRHAESTRPAAEDDAIRLWPLAVSIETQLEDMAGAFSDMAQ